MARTLSFPQSTINSRLARIVTGLKRTYDAKYSFPDQRLGQSIPFPHCSKELTLQPAAQNPEVEDERNRVSGGEGVNSVSSARRFNGDQGLRANPKPSAKKTEKHTCVATLTPRQAEIVGLLAKGLSDKEIAHNMDISEETVAYHLRVLFAHRHVHSRAGLLGDFARSC